MYNKTYTFNQRTEQRTTQKRHRWFWLYLRCLNRNACLDFIYMDFTSKNILNQEIYRKIQHSSSNMKHGLISEGRQWFNYNRTCMHIVLNILFAYLICIFHVLISFLVTWNHLKQTSQTKSSGNVSLVSTFI